MKILSLFEVRNSILICEKEDHFLSYNRASLQINLPNQIQLILSFSEMIIYLVKDNNVILQTTDLSVLKDLSIQELNVTINRLLMLSRFQ
jgi:hypothetical protein